MLLVRVYLIVINHLHGADAKLTMMILLVNSYEIFAVNMQLCLNDNPPCFDQKSLIPYNFNRLQ